jgi:hypothetical protein
MMIPTLHPKVCGTRFGHTKGKDNKCMYCQRDLKNLRKEVKEYENSMSRLRGTLSR